MGRRCTATSTAPRARPSRTRLHGGQDVVLEIDWQGALQIKQLFPNAVLIFILPPSWDELLQRLQRRGEDGAEVIERRMANARLEVAQARHFDFVIINALFETALFDLKTDRALAAPEVRGPAPPPPAGLRCARPELNRIHRKPAMARITVEDCLVKIPNRFQLVLAATYRARMLSQGHAPKIETQEQARRDRAARDRRRRDRHRDAAQGADLSADRAIAGARAPPPGRPLSCCRGCIGARVKPR